MMLQLPFSKYQGTGNDFVMIDNRAGGFPTQDTDRIARLCDRRFGVGADGLILLQEAAGYDFEMVYFNADGRQASFCGNGGRCVVAFARALGVIEAETHFLAYDGAHQASITPEGEIALRMSDVAHIKDDPEGCWLHTGSPHLVCAVENLDTFPVVEQGRALRRTTRFAPEGTNVNFIQSIDEQTLSVRTYERGVEDETLSCGTGVTAVALAHLRTHPVGEHTLRVRTRGGVLTVRFRVNEGGSFSEIWLVGPAQRVFVGTIDFV